MGTRDSSTQVPVNYELPQAAVSEAIVNAIAHRDYTSNASIQVMLFKNRLEIWNPGQLPLGLTTEKLRQPHTSIPANPLLAEPMYLAGYIERLGTGTGDIIRLCNELDLREPDFVQEEIFKTIIWRTGSNEPQATPQATPQAGYRIKEEIKRIVMVLEGEMKRQELQDKLRLRDRKNFSINDYWIPYSTI